MEKQIKGSIEYEINFKENNTVDIIYDSSIQNNFISLKMTHDMIEKLIEVNNKLHKKHPNKMPKEQRSALVKSNYVLKKIINNYANKIRDEK